MLSCVNLSKYCHYLSSLRFFVVSQQLVNQVFWQLSISRPNRLLVQDQMRQLKVLNVSRIIFLDKELSPPISLQSREISVDNYKNKSNKKQNKKKTVFLRKLFCFCRCSLVCCRLPHYCYYCYCIWYMHASEVRERRFVAR